MANENELVRISASIKKSTNTVVIREAKKEQRSFSNMVDKILTDWVGTFPNRITQRDPSPKTSLKK